MTADRDLVLVETVRTHRARLVAAFLHGGLTQRRPANDNLRRLAVGIVLAAVACVGCIGYALISTYLADHQSGTAVTQIGTGR